MINGSSNRFTYTYDKIGNRATQVEANGVVSMWTYDEANQLTGEQRSGINGFNLTYGYDATGNRTAETDVATSLITTSTYDTANQLTGSADGNGSVTGYEYDDSGNRIEKEVDGVKTFYSYDADDQMLSAEPAAGVVSFTYNADGQRVAKYDEASGETKKFLYDFKHLLQERDGNDDLQREYAFGPEDYYKRGQGYGDLVGEYNFDTDTNLAHNYDAQWNTDALIDDTGSVTAKFMYKAFGQIDNQTGTDTTNLSFAGQQGYYQDPEIELYMLGMSGQQNSADAASSKAGRMYDPVTGQFLSRDPLGLDTDRLKNAYRYVDNNPINTVDPSGQIAYQYRNTDPEGGALTLVKRFTSRSRCQDTWNVKISAQDNEASTRHVVYNGKENGQNFYEGLGTIQLYTPPFEDNFITRAIPIVGDSTTKGLVKASSVLNAIQTTSTFDISRRSFFGGRHNLREPVVEFNINKWWAGQSGIKGAVDNLEVDFFDLFRIGSEAVRDSYDRVKDGICHQMDRFGLKDACSTIGKIVTDCQGAGKAAVDAGKTILSSIFYKGPEIITTVITGAYDGFNKFKDGIGTHIVDLLKDMLSIQGVDLTPLPEAFKACFGFGENGGASCVNSLLGVVKTIGEVVGLSAGSIVNTIAGVDPFSAIQPVLALGFDFINGFLENPADAVSNATSFLQDGFSGAVNDVREGITNFVDEFKTGLQESFGKALLSALGKFLPAMIGRLAGGPVLALVDIIKTVISQCGDFKSVIEKTGAIFDDLSSGKGSSVSEKFLALLVSGLKVAVNFIAKFSKVSKFFDSAREAIENLRKKVVDLIKKAAAKIGSPFASLFGSAEASFASATGKNNITVIVTQNGDVRVSRSPSETFQKYLQCVPADCRQEATRLWRELTSVSRTAKEEAQAIRNIKGRANSSFKASKNKEFLKRLNALKEFLNQEKCSVRTIIFTGVPGITANIKAAFASGKPRKLTRRSKVNNSNRTEACGDVVCSDPLNNSCDEYPFHSSHQGGAGATIRCVPVQENRQQGIQLSAFYSRCVVKIGDKFEVDTEK